MLKRFYYPVNPLCAMAAQGMKTVVRTWYFSIFLYLSSRKDLAGVGSIWLFNIPTPPLLFDITSRSNLPIAPQCWVPQIQLLCDAPSTGRPPAFIFTNLPPLVDCRVPPPQTPARRRHTVTTSLPPPMRHRPRPINTTPLKCPPQRQPAKSPLTPSRRRPNTDAPPPMPQRCC